jgi:ketosteroid isomerase-like protein
MYAAEMMQLLFMLAIGFQPAANDGVAHLREEWARNLYDKHVEASVAEYAADADFIDPTGNRVHGAVAIRKLFQTITATFDSDLEFRSQRVETSGDLTYDSGMFCETLTMRATGKRQEINGSYLTIYRKKDGTWLIVEQIWASSPLEAGSR